MRFMMAAAIAAVMIGGTAQAAPLVLPDLLHGRAPN